MKTERDNGLHSGGFSFLPCSQLGNNEGFEWDSGALDSHSTNNGSSVPPYQKDKIRKAIQRFWDSNGRTQNLILDRTCVHKTGIHPYWIKCYTAINVLYFFFIHE